MRSNDALLYSRTKPKPGNPGVKELGYVSLNEVMAVRGPMGLAIERDLFWSPKRLRDLAPELFASMEETDQGASQSVEPSGAQP